MEDVVGKRLIRRLLDTKNIDLLKEKGLVIEDFNDDARHVLNWIYEFIEKNNEIPTVQIVQENLGINIPLDDASTDYLIDNVRKRSLTGNTATILKKAAVYLENREPDKALDILEFELPKLHRAQSSFKPALSYIQSGLIRFDKYLKIKNRGLELVGAATPWSTLNNDTQGWIDGWMYVIAAMTWTGKTWALCICAEHYSKHQPKLALFVSAEMERERIARRIDAIRYKIPFAKLRKCHLDDLTEKEWKDALDKYVENQTSLDNDIIIVDKKTARTVADVNSLVRQYKPGIVFIDGGYRLESSYGNRDGGWEQSKVIVEDIQYSAEKTNIPWVVTTQLGELKSFGKKKTKEDRAAAGTVKYAQEWLINPDVFIAMYQDEDLRLTNLMEMYTRKIRDADMITPMFTINWNMEAMNFNEVVPEQMSIPKQSEIAY